MCPCSVWRCLVYTATAGIHCDTCWFRGCSGPQLKVENKTAASSFSPVNAGSLEGDSAACRAAERRALMLEASHFNMTAELRSVMPAQPEPCPTHTRRPPLAGSRQADFLTLLPAPMHQIWPECSLWRCGFAGSGSLTFIFNGACPSWQRRLLQQPATEKRRRSTKWEEAEIDSLTSDCSCTALHCTGPCDRKL